nr:GNAT family N-acetyltransferase [Mycobacterium parmense]
MEARPAGTGSQSPARRRGPAPPADAAANVDAAGLATLQVFAGVPASELTALAAGLSPLAAGAGDVLMCQGEQALSFAIIASGRVEVRHVAPDGQTVVTVLSPETIVGEIALLRRKARTATVIAKDAVRGYTGYSAAFDCMLAMPAVADSMVRTARGRLAANITPIPFSTKDGAPLLLRPVLPGDAERFTSNGAFSRQTLYRRYQGAAPTEARLAYLFEVDYVDHFVWVVVDSANGAIVADARFIRDEDDASSAEVALTVADAYQGRGIGTMLLGALAVAARVGAVERFHARVLSDNPPARALGAAVNARWHQEEPGVVTTTGEIPESDGPALDARTCRRVQQVARQVIHAFD